MSLASVLAEITRERQQQDAKWGEQNHPDGTGLFSTQRLYADRMRELTEEAARAGKLTWRHILEEEEAEALAESDPAKLRAELVQLAAVAVAWIEAIDRRGPGSTSPEPGPTPCPDYPDCSEERLVRDMAASVAAGEPVGRWTTGCTACGTLTKGDLE